MALTTPSRLSRREFKYLIDDEMAERIRRYISGICTIDPYAQKTGSYLIDTLYLDTPRLDLYHATVEDSGDRYKLRIRGYPSAKSAPVFFEVKRRVNDAVFKTRGYIRGNWQRVLMDGIPEVLSEIGDDQRRGIDNFICHFFRSPMQATVLVRYNREPYFSLIDQYARVTMDRSLCSQAATELSLEPSDAAWSALDFPIAQRGLDPERSQILLELKFTNMVPGWMRDMVQTLNLQRLSFCKYTRAVDAMRWRPSDRIPRASFLRG